MTVTSGCLKVRNTQFTRRGDPKKGADEIGRGDDHSAYFVCIKVQLGQQAIKKKLSFLQPSSFLQIC